MQHFRKKRPYFYTAAYLMARCKIDDNDCWIWQGAKDSTGRGYVGRNQTSSRLVHRVMYIIKYGEVAEELDLDHKCRQRGCANPDHLEPVTRSENLRRRYIARGELEAYGRGHPYVEGSYYDYGNGKMCKECLRIRGRVYDQVRRPKKVNPALVLDLEQLFPSKGE